MRGIGVLLFALIVSSWSAAASTSWTCVPQEILIGQWKIEIHAGLNSLQAKTYYMPDIAPRLRPLVGTFIINQMPLPLGMVYFGNNFQLSIFPLRAPARNPYYQNQNAVDAFVFEVQFSPEVTLRNRQLCLCKSNQEDQ